jgi:hypothetical protein
MKKHLLSLFTLMIGLLAGATFAQIPDAALVVQDFNITPVLVTGTTLLGSFLQLAPAGALCTYAMVSVPKKSSNAGAPSPKKDKIVVFRWGDVPAPPARDAKGIVITTDLTLDAAADAIEIYITPGTLSVKQTQEGDIDAKAWLQEISGQHPGDDILIDEFLANNINENLGLIVAPYDAAADKKLCGSPSAPLQIEAESLDDKEGNKNTITFKSTMRGPRIAHYQGAMPTLDTDTGA